MAENESKEGDGKKPGKRWYVEKLAIPIAMLVLGGVFTSLWANFNGRLRAFTYSVVPSSGLFQWPQMPGKDVRLMIDNQSIGNISTVSVSVYNSTDQDYDNVPLNVSFSSEGRYPPKLIFASATQPDGSPSIPTNKLTTEPASLLRFTYLLEVANRSETKPIWTAIYTFEGPQAPVTNIAVQKKGLVATPLKANNEMAWKFIDSIAIWLVPLLGVLGMLLWNYGVGKYYEHKFTKSRTALIESKKLTPLT